MLVWVGLMVTMIMSPAWHWFPVEITEQTMVVAVTESGCIADAPTLGLPINIGHCDALPGDIVEATYLDPARTASGHYERISKTAART